jgi:hypothetical protein
MDDSDWAADMVERERQALIARARAGLPPPNATPRGAVFGSEEQPAPQKISKGARA